MVSLEEMKMSCSLQRPSNLNYSGWFGSSDLYQYINFYFIAAPKLGKAVMSRFYYPRTRVRDLSSGARAPIQQWERALGPRSGQEEVENIYRLYGYEKVNLNQILQGHFTNQDPLSQMHRESVIDAPGSLSDSHNVYFEISIKLSEDIFPPPSGPGRSPQRPDEVNIMAFAQIDVKALQEDFGIHPKDSGLSQIGGELVLEKCLIKSAQSNFGMVVPRTRKVFSLPDGRMYSGPVHYHPDVDGRRGPNGYVGYMAGPAAGDMSNRETLSVREIPNNKVVAKVLTDVALNANGELLTQNNSYNGFGNDSSFEAEDYGMLSLGDNILSALRSQYGTIISTSPNISNREKNKRLKDLSVASLRKGKLNIVHSFTNLSPKDLSWINIQGGRPYHGNLFALDLNNLLRYNSEYGHIAERHSVNNIDNPNPSARPTIQKSQQLLREFVNLSKIYNIDILRERVSNLPKGNNVVSTPDYESLGEDEIIKKMITSTSPARPNQGSTRDGSVILRSENNFCEISERSPSPSTLRKVFFFKDYDLFERHSFGNYEYKVDLKIGDGILIYMRRALQRLRVSIKEYESYVQEASRPYLDVAQSSYYNGSTLDNSQETTRTLGNYNHSTDRFTAEFIRRSTALRSRSDSVVNSYFDSYFLLTANPAFTEAQKQQIKESLLAQNATLQFLEFFLSLCKKLESRFESILKKTGIDISQVTSLGSNLKPVSSSSRTPKSIIHLNGSTNVIAKAVSKNSVFMSVDLPTSNLASNITAGAHFFAINRADSISRSTRSGINFSFSQIATINNSLSSKKNNESFAEVSAAINKSKFGGALSVEGEEHISNEYKKIDNLLSSYKNTTFRSLVSEATEPVEKESDKEGRAQKFIGKEVQESILASILQSDNSTMFEEEVEKNYKDLFFSKKALGGLYSVVKESMSNYDLLNNSREETKETYKSKVMSNTDSKTERSNSSESYEDSLKEKVDPFTSFEILDEEVSYGIVIHKKSNSQYADAVLVNNVQFNDNSQTQTPESQKATPSPGINKQEAGKPAGRGKY